MKNEKYTCFLALVCQMVLTYILFAITFSVKYNFPKYAESLMNFHAKSIKKIKFVYEK